jgi:hypothetical protein
MQNRDNKFETLIGNAKSMLNYSFEGLKRKYLSYPISITVHVENRVLGKAIEVRFDKQEATISIDFDQKDKCNATYLFFDTESNEDSFIEYLAESYDFDFRKNCWLLYDCYLKIREFKDCTFFCFYK